jgi:hypothetical protein
MKSVFRLAARRTGLSEEAPQWRAAPVSEKRSSLSCEGTSADREPSGIFSLTPPLLYVLVRFMSAATQLPAPTTAPDPPRAAPTTPSRLGRVLSLVRRLIDYGKQLVGTLHQRAAAPGFARFASPFGTADLAVILARITGGLRRAAALEARLCRRAARGQDLTPSPIRLPAPRGPRPARQVAPPEPQPADQAEDPRLARLPTEAEIAAEVRRRPVGAVIVDICLDLGIAPGHLDRAFWDEINHAIRTYGGSLARFLQNLYERGHAFRSGGHSDCADPGWPAAPPRLLALATGPP